MSEIISTSQAAALLGVGLRTIQVWSEKGVLKPAYKHNGRLKFSRDYIEGILKSGKDIQKPKNIEV